MARRLSLLEWASAAGAWILEDDYDSEFRYVGRPLAAFLQAGHFVRHIRQMRQLYHERQVMLVELAR